MSARYASMALLLGGCALQPAPVPEINWTGSGTEAEFEQARSDCGFEAEKATAAYSPGYIPPTQYGLLLQQQQRGDLINRKIAVFLSCMRARGFTAIRGK